MHATHFEVGSLMKHGSFLAGSGVSARLAMLHVGILISTSVSSVATDIDCIGLAIWAWRGPLSALQALSVFVVIRTMNPLLIQIDSVSSALAWALPPLVAIRMLPLIKTRDVRLIAPLWLFCLAAICCSIAASPALAVSIMKAVSLAIIVTSVLVASFRLAESEVMALGIWLRTLAAGVATLLLA